MSQIEDIQTPALPTDGQTVATKSATWTPPAFKVSGVFSSHMVLQRDESIRVWGFSDTPGSRVTGTFMGETAEAEVGADYRFTLTFSAHPYSREPETMTVSDDRDHAVTFEDILIGDVYLVGGQSNSELNLCACMHLTPSAVFDENDNFRIFMETQEQPYIHQELCVEPQPDVIYEGYTWKRPTEEASLRFSALGWYFAKEMQKQIDIPLGVLSMAAGGACLSELLPAELAHAQGYTCGANVPEGGYYNTLIHPIEGLAFRAQIFFQGESEGIWRERAEKYCYELALLVTDERARFGRDFPFYNVQLCDYCEEGAKNFVYSDIVRNQQFDATKVIPNYTVTASMDLGPDETYHDWAHSPRKLELAERLAALVLAKEYGIGRVTDAQCPSPVSATLNADRTQIIVEFTDVGAGLIVSGHTPADSYGMEVAGFFIGDYDHRTPVRATIVTRHSCMVEIPADLDPAALTHVGYAYAAHVTPETANLRGGNNLPALAFSIKIAGV